MNHLSNQTIFKQYQSSNDEYCSCNATMLTKITKTPPNPQSKAFATSFYVQLNFFYTFCVQFIHWQYIESRKVQCSQPMCCMMLLQSVSSVSQSFSHPVSMLCLVLTTKNNIVNFVAILLPIRKENQVSLFLFHFGGHIQRQPRSLQED